MLNAVFFVFVCLFCLVNNTSTLINQADAPRDDTSGAYMTATAVTTRTATTHEDLGKNAKTEQLEEKTVATTRTHDPNRQQQRVVTQEVKTTATVTSGDQVFACFSWKNRVCESL